MTNLTLAIDDDLLRAARIKAVQEGTSVNEICREAIARYAQPAQRDGDDFLAQLRVLAARMAKRSSHETAWPGREAMYEEAMAERMPTLWATFDRATRDRGNGEGGGELGGKASGDGGTP